MLIKQIWKVWMNVKGKANPSCTLSAPPHTLTWIFVFFFFFSRLTDPIPTTETSIAPRQRPKAGQTQPNPGILPIQPALTPRKRATVQPPLQPAGQLLRWLETWYTSLLSWTIEKSWKAWLCFRDGIQRHIKSNGFLWGTRGELPLKLYSKRPAKGDACHWICRGSPRSLKPVVSIFSGLGPDLMAWYIYPIPTSLFHWLLFAFKEAKVTSCWHTEIVSLMVSRKLSVTVLVFFF